MYIYLTGSGAERAKLGRERKFYLQISHARANPVRPCFENLSRLQTRGISYAQQRPLALSASIKTSVPGGWKSK